MIELLPPHLRAKILVDDCWIWTGAVDAKTGYGKGSLPPYRRRGIGIHRLVYELLIGPIPPGKHLHHTCRNRRCCNPAHLQTVTSLEHHRLEPSQNAFERNKTHCPQGHLLDGRRGDGKRYCLTCNRKRALAAYYKKRRVSPSQ
jgi:HNH endonuclease